MASALSANPVRDVQPLRSKSQPKGYLGEQVVTFASTAGTLRDPNNFGKEWRTAR